jgi:hypothetical protein
MHWITLNLDMRHLDMGVLSGDEQRIVRDAVLGDDAAAAAYCERLSGVKKQIALILAYMLAFPRTEVRYNNRTTAG